MTKLSWLPEPIDFNTGLRALPQDQATAWDRACTLANTQLNFIQTNNLDKMLRRGGAPTATVRLALLGSSTMAHLHAAIRVAGMRRGLAIEIYEADYGQYWQELSDPDAGLRDFKPTHILLALDAHHLASGVTASLTEDDAAATQQMIQARITGCWQLARDGFRCPVIHQSPLPVHSALLGNNEHRLPGSKAGFVARLAAWLPDAASTAGVDLLAIDTRAGRDGLAAWHEPGLWHRAKQEISPPAAPMYGEQLARLIAAHQGRSSKCLVLDLDNTLWGGVVGDDGTDGLVLGQGSALGEAFVAFQAYARELSRRGVILAVCSKNDEANALEPFDRHPDMVLRRDDIACFVANWSDKATNIRAIASELNIGLDSLVFVDDNPFERNLVREELPMVAVPEVGDDPTGFIQIIADAGYFEAVGVTEEDRERTAQYQGNRQRAQLQASVTDLPAYLRSLEMRLIWRRFDLMGLGRTVQLINKTNQFNLTTRRYSEDDVRAVMNDKRAFGLQLRLIDRFGDNGIIAILIGKMQNDSDLLIDTWLMSCRVLGRQVEPTTLNLLASEATRLGACRLVGEYIPTKKNAMVKDHYSRLGFETIETSQQGGSMAALDLARFAPVETFISVQEG